MGYFPEQRLVIKPRVSMESGKTKQSYHSNQSLCCFRLDEKVARDSEQIVSNGDAIFWFEEKKKNRLYTCKLMFA